MKIKKFNKPFIKIVAVLVVITLINSAFSILPLNIFAEGVGGNWDYKAYAIDKDSIYPQQSTWGWPINITESNGDVSLKYNNAGCNYAYTSAITRVSPHNAHITMTVEDADRFYVMFGLRQQHYQLNSVSFLINRANRSFDVYIGKPQSGSYQKIVTFNNVGAFDNTKDVNVKLTKVESGYSFLINDYEYILSADTFKQHNSYLKGCFDSNGTNIYFNVAPDTSTPKFTFKAIHSGEQVCYDEIAEEFSLDEMNALFEVISAIEDIDDSITIDSKISIENARAIYNQLNDNVKQYIFNYNDLVYAEDAYNAIIKETVNVDSQLYPITMLNVGPKIYSGWENKVKFTKAVEGVTVEIKEATVHNAGLNVSNPLGLDGLHLRFKNCEYVGQGEEFVLQLYNNAQIDMTNPSKILWLTFSVKDKEVNIRVYSKNNSGGVSLISTSQITKADMANWDVLFLEQEDRSYKVTINGSVSGIIPVNYIEDALAQGLNFNGLYVTLGYNNFGSIVSGSYFKMDCVSAHDGNSPCSNDLYEEYGLDKVLVLKETIAAIEAIGYPVTLESKTAIETAENAYNSLDNELKKYITTYEDLVSKRKLYEKLIGGFVDMDYAAHSVEKSNIGPNIYSGWENFVNWYDAESGKGVTIDLTNTTVHAVGLNVKKPLGLDGFHLTFGKGLYENQAKNFALNFHKMAQIDLTSNAKQLWMYFSLSESSVKISVQSASKNSLDIINTTYVTLADFEKGWDIKIEKLEDESYLVTLNGVVSGIIPKEYIDDAVSNGLDINSFIVTLGSNNFGNVAYHLKADCISVHDGKSNCYSHVSDLDVERVVDCEKLIDEIGKVDANSGEAIELAEKAFNNLGEFLQGIVKNSEELNNKTKEYSVILKDIKKADIVEKLIAKLPSKINNKSYDDLLNAYFEYLDLYPRIRKYVENSDVLLKHVNDYEKSHKGIDLANESMNKHTDGKKAHYLKELTMNLFS